MLTTFDPEGKEAFKRFICDSKRYGEYGAGQSTIYAHENASCKIFSVDTSESWIAEVTSQLPDSQRIVISHIDLGPLGDWGRPLTLDYQYRFEEYFLFPWRQGGNRILC